MNNKGFTLVELLASLTILAIISILMTTTVQYSVTNVKTKNYETLKKMIVEATINYINSSNDEYFSLDNIKPEKSECNKTTDCLKEFTIGDILDKNIYYTNEKDKDGNLTLISPKDNEDMRNKTIIIYYDKNEYTIKGMFKEDYKGE